MSPVCSRVTMFSLLYKELYIVINIEREQSWSSTNVSARLKLNIDSILLF